MKYSFNFIYSANGTLKSTSNTDNSDFSVEIKENDNITELTVKPNTEIQFTKFAMKIPYRFNSAQRIFTNGYQS